MPLEFRILKTNNEQIIFNRVSRSEEVNITAIIADDKGTRQLDFQSIEGEDLTEFIKFLKGAEKPQMSDRRNHPMIEPANPNR